MNPIDNYTVTEILEMYKEMIKTDIEKIINTVLYEDSNIFKEEIDKKMIQYANLQDENMYLQIRSKVAYRQVIQKFCLNTIANNDNQIKLALLCDIHRRFSKRISPKETEKLKKLILGKQSFAIFKYYSDRYPGIHDYEIIVSDKQEKLDSIKDNKMKEALNEYFSDFSLVSDINLFIKQKYTKDMYNVIINKLLIKFFLDEKRMNPREYKEHISKGDFLDVLDKDESLRKEFEKQMKAFFRDNLQFIDKEILLYNLAAETIIGIKLIKGEKVQQLTLNRDNDFNERESMKSYIDFLRKIYSIISDKKYDNVENYSIYGDNNEVLITVNKDYIKNFLDRCTQNDYLNDEDIEQIHIDILEGILTEDIEKRKIANVNLDDLKNVSKKYKQYDEQEENKKRILKCGIELADYLVSSGQITNQELIELYLQGEFDYKIMAGINMSEFTEEYYASKFKELYYQMVFSQEPKETKKRLERFSMLYVELEKTGELSINQDELISDITMVFGEDFICPILSDLHELNIITIEKGIEWVGADIFIEEYKKGKLKPQEVRSFYEENKEKHLNDIVRIINKLPDNGEKFMVIGSIFPEETEEDKETRELLFDECLRIENGIKNNNSGNKRKDGENKSNDYYKHITDPFARISLIKALDRDYSFEMTGDGHAIVKLPSFGKVIIEKMLNKNREPSYGAATYILDEKYYEDNKFRIKKDEKISRQEIIKDIDSGKVTRIIHSVKTWGADIKEYFLQTEKVEWSKNEIKVIDEAIGRVKRSDPIARDRQQLAKMILNLIVTRKATLEQIEKIAEMYDVDLGKVMNSLDER